MNKLYKLGLAAALYSATILGACSGRQENQNHAEQDLNHLYPETVIYSLSIFADIDTRKNYRITFVDEGDNKILDRVIIIKKTKRTIIKPGDPDFEEQNKIFKEKILPLYHSCPIEKYIP